jgi:hypothetical protein
MNKISIWQPHVDYKTQFTNSDGAKNYDLIFFSSPSETPFGVEALPPSA